jgi:hypothetical protein
MEAYKVWLKSDPPADADVGVREEAAEAASRVKLEIINLTGDDESSNAALGAPRELIDLTGDDESSDDIVELFVKGLNGHIPHNVCQRILFRS